MQSKETVYVMGAGLAGSLMALLLGQRGYQVEVYERRPDMRRVALSAGRSINLALSTRGLTALDMAGMREEMLGIAIPMPGRMLHGLDGELTFQPYSHDPSHYINSISRGELNKHLMNRAESHERVNFHFEHRCDDVDFETGVATLTRTDTDETFQLPAAPIIACDGAFSAVRYDMQKTPRFNFSQSYLDHGYKELTIPPGPGGKHLIDPNALHIWPRGEYMLIALPNLDGSFTCTLFFPYKGKYSFEQLNTKEEVRSFFETTFPDAVPLMPSLVEDYFENPTSSLVTIHCYPWVRGKVCLLGDASHAIVPFFGQGMNAAFEDCRVMAECIDAASDNLEQAFQHFQEKRKPNADAIARMAIENYVEMRAKTADPRFLFRKEVEHHLERYNPHYLSRYEMVSFTNVPYAEAYRRGELNQRVLNEITEGVDRIEDMDWERANRVIEEKMKSAEVVG